MISEPSDTAEVAEPAATLVTIAAGNATHIKLVIFWPQNLALWFAQAECQFEVKGMSGQVDRYCHAMSALLHDSLCLVADLEEALSSNTAYENIKHWLVASHQLLNFQKAEKLFLMQPLGSRKPSEMLWSMLEAFPRGEEKTNLFPVFSCSGFQGKSGPSWLK
jgi:hypothetical protein